MHNGLKEKDVRIIAMGSILMFYIFYLAYIQRGVEERYTLPLLSIAIMLSASVLRKLKDKLKPLLT
jgi:hypothetical protein